MLTVDQAAAAIKNAAHAMSKKGKVVATSRIQVPRVDDYVLTNDGRLLKITNVHSPASGPVTYYGDELGPEAGRTSRIQDRDPFLAAWRVTIGEKVLMPEQM